MSDQNILLQIQNMKIQIRNIDAQLENIIMQIRNPQMSNIGTQINNIGIQLLNIGNQMFNIGMFIPNYNQMEILNQRNNIKNILTELKNDNDAWLEGFKLGIEEINGKNLNDNKISVCFITTLGSKITLRFDYETTMGQVLKEFLLKIGKPELIKEKNKLSFQYNDSKLDFENKTKIKTFFHNVNYPKIVINDSHNLIGVIN